MNGIHLAFFVSTSGLYRFKNESLDRFPYDFGGGDDNSDNVM
jgi:hypothetical protein